MEDLAKDLMEELNCETVFTIPIFGGIDVSESVVVTWIIMAVLVLVAIILTRNMKIDHISKRQAIAETIVTKLTGMVEDMPYLKDFKRVMINPVILEESDQKCDYAEGCLSVPNIYYDVTRPKAIKVEYYDENLERKVEELDKFDARMVQHEMSHLDGNLFIDLVPQIRRKMLQGKLTNISKGKVRTQYKTIIK